MKVVDRSGQSYDLDGSRWRGDDGSPLTAEPQVATRPDEIDVAERSLWRYRLPVSPEHKVSMGEGMTPMVGRIFDDREVYFKLEWFNPTSSFKDRGVSVMVSYLASQGATHILEDSSGNGGSSVAAYAAAAGIDATIIAPATTSEAKIFQIGAFGATIEKVGGTRDDVSAEAVRRSETIPYASHAWHPMFLQGTKTVAYEMWESLGFTAPDNVVMVSGGGSLALGCDIAFTELLEAGLIDHRPRLLIGQPEHWARIVDELNGTDAPAERRPTIAEGASIASSVRLDDVVAAVRRSNGAGVRVSDAEIALAMKDLLSMGLFAEPTSSVAAAALRRFIADGTIGEGETTVVILTGSGLKSVEKMAQGLAMVDE